MSELCSKIKPVYLWALFALSIFYGLQAVAQETNDPWRALTGDPNCSYLDDVNDPSYPTTSTWTGECHKNRLHGKGVLTLKFTYPETSNDDYTTNEVKGTYANGQLQNEGIFSWEQVTNGTTKSLTYTGSFKDSLFHGYGVIEIPGKIELKGVFKDGELNGPGTLRLQGLATVEGIFKGNFVKGTLYGKGTIHHNDGDQYKGEFKGALEHGVGVKTFADGRRYEGEFKNGNFNGQGAITYEDGLSLEGTFVAGVLQGQGKLSLPSGHIYEGKFVDDVPNGVGVMHLPDGRTCEGEWKSSTLIGIGMGLVNGQQKSCFMEGKTIRFTDYFRENP